MQQLRASVEGDGWIGAITVAADGETFDGSARVEVAGDLLDGAIVVRSDGTKPIVHIREDIPTASDPRALRLGIAANRVAEANLEWDASVLAELAEEVDLTAFWSTDEIAALLEQEAPTSGGGDDAPEVEDGPTRCQPGDLWRLGRHRLLCGDSTKADDTGRLMTDERADMVFTDPPYGVSYADKNRYLNAVAPANRIQIPILGDHEDIEETAAMWQAAFITMHDAMRPGAVFYVTAPQGGDQMMMMMMMMMSAVLPVRHELMWLKNNHVLGRADYAYKHEPILYGWRRDGSHYYGGGFQTSVWEIDKPQKSDLHPTMKPIELVERAVSNSSRPGDLVIDWFLGSGTTIIACERTGRRCYGIEIEPRYCDVILKRWEAETGLVAERID